MDYKKLPQEKHMMATQAIHKLGDFSRDTYDLCCVYGETETDWIGAWITGLGFFDVRFPKETTRVLTPAEVEKYNKTSVRIGSQPARQLKVD